MRKHAIAALLLLTAAAIPTFAQRRGPPVHRSISSFGSAREAQFPRTLYLGNPLWYDDYATRDTATSVIVVQARTAPVSSPRPVFDDPKPAAPLLIEWQGDRYVRRTSGSSSQTSPAPLDYAAPTRINSPVHQAHSLVPANSAATTHDDHLTRPAPAPATFIFGDGHREQSSDYTIVQGTIYARGDYWTSGSWSKKIPIAQLDVPATLRANAENGVPFRLPSAPNEIITRP